MTDVLVWLLMYSLRTLALTASVPDCEILLLTDRFDTGSQRPYYTYIYIGIVKCTSRGIIPAYLQLTRIFRTSNTGQYQN